MSNISNLNGTLVIGALKVPVRNITDAILDRSPVDVIQKRFPVSVDEIFECLDAIADHDTIDIHDRLVVVNQSINADEITLATTSIADTIFLKVLQMGRNTDINITDINDLYDIGFRTLAIESYEDKLNGDNHLEEVSDIHSIVNSAISNAVPDIDPSTILRFLKEE
tara:strand:- start:1310 stop:1810 length:501 start_codon:yes stop_codon:yes gene_type:complete